MFERYFVLSFLTKAAIQASTPKDKSLSQISRGAVAASRWQIESLRIARLQID
jgi:hypothetical protein